MKFIIKILLLPLIFIWKQIKYMYWDDREHRWRGKLYWHIGERSDVRLLDDIEAQHFGYRNYIDMCRKKEHYYSERKIRL